MLVVHADLTDNQLLFDDEKKLKTNIQLKLRWRQKLVNISWDCLGGKGVPLVLLSLENAQDFTWAELGGT
jgi:hypothetical protein